MTKLQRIKRANGSVIYSVNIPKEIIEELGWEKGTNLDLESWTDYGKKVIKISKNEVEPDATSV